MPLRGWLSLPWCLGAVVPAPPWPSPKQFQLFHPIAVDGPGLPCLPTPTLDMPMLSRRHPARYLVRSLILIGSPSLCDPPKYPFSHTSACLLKQLLSHSVAIRRALGVMFTTRPHL